jgi:DNA-binding SARP family transcriptional activator
VLGGIGMAVGGHEVTLRGRQRRRLVAALLAAAPRPVSTEHLVWVLGTDDPGATGATDPANAVHVHVKRLRALLEPGRAPSQARWLRSSPGGYAFEPDAVDLWDYRTAVDEASTARYGEPARAIAAYERAFSLWDVPFGPLAADEAVAADAARLEQAHLDHEDDYGDLRLDAGSAGDVADAIVAAARAQPIREHRWAQAMQALFQANRQAEALRLFGEARDVLIGELGLEPGPELREMEQRVLRQDPVLLGRPQRSTVRGVPATSFVGRSREMGELDAAVDRHRVVTVVGMGGIGKTRLVAEWLSRSPRGRSAQWVDLRGIGDDGAARTRIATDLGIAGSESEPLDLIDLVVATLDDRRLLVIDNAESGLDAVGELVTRATEELRDVRFLITSRVPLGLTGEAVLPIAPLPVPDAGAELAGTAVELVMDRLGPGADEAHARRLALRFGGVPYPLELVAAAGGHVGAAPAEHPGRDGSVSAEVAIADAVDVALDHVSDDAVDVLWTALLLPDGATGALLDAIHGRADTEFPRRHRDRLLRELVAASLLSTGAAAGGTRYRGSEPLARLASDRLPSPVATGRLIAAAGWWSTLARSSFFDPPSRSGVLALAADHRNIVHVLGAIESEHPEACLELAGHMVDHWDRSGHTAEGARWVRAAMARLDDRSPLYPLGISALVACSGGVAMHAQHLALLEQGRRQLLEDGRVGSDLWAVTHLQLAIARGWNGDLAGCDDALDEARLQAVRADSDWWAAVVQRYGSLRFALTGEPATGRIQAEDSADLFVALDDLGSAAGALYFASLLGRMAGATDLSELHVRGRALAEAADAVQMKALIVVEQAQHARRCGDPSAPELLGEAATLTERTGNLRTGSVARRDLGLLLLDLGRAREAVDHLVRAARHLLRLDTRAAALALAGLSVAARSAPALSAELAVAAWCAAASDNGAPLTDEDTRQLRSLAGEAPGEPLGRDPAGVLADAAELLTRGRDRTADADLTPG